MTFDCIVPAAGASSRMGSWKPLLPWGGASVLGTVVSRARAAGAAKVIVVAGFRGGEIVELLEGEPGVEVVLNADWERGMLGSILAGLSRLGSPAFFVTPADMPLVEEADYRLLVDAADRAPSHSRSWFPEFEGELGHPVLIPSSLVPEIAALDPGGRLRPFLLAHGAGRVAAASSRVLADLDCAADYVRLAPAPVQGGGAAG